MKFHRKLSWVAGLALIAATNALILGGAAYNRGAADSTLALSERELRLAWPRDSDNSGLALRLRWRVPADEKTGAVRFEYGEYRDDPTWLDAAKMAALGFDTSLPDGEGDLRRSFQRQLARDAFIVLELDGAAYQASLEAAAAEADKLRSRNDPQVAERAARLVPMERDRNSRIFAVDAGLDEAALRTKYPDRAHYAIVRGQVEPAARYARTEGAHRGRIRGLSIAEIHVPVELRAAFEGATPDDGMNSSAHYDATVMFGRRWEPWLATAARR